MPKLNLVLTNVYTWKFNPIFNIQFFPLVTCFTNILEKFSEQQPDIFGNFTERMTWNHTDALKI